MRKQKFTEDMKTPREAETGKTAADGENSRAPGFLGNTKALSLVLLALTLVFLGALAWAALRENAAEPRGDYSVSVERSASAEELVPEKRLIDINTAAADELEELNGIGPALAQAIVDYRGEHGSFASVDELLEVSGIGEAKLNGIREYVTVGGNE